MSNLKALRLQQAGICCAVGYNLSAAYCAMRAKMDHFQESDFVDTNRKPLRVARLPVKDLWGEERMAVMAATAVRDCLRRGSLGAGKLGVVLLAAEEDRPHSEPERYDACQHAIDEVLVDQSVALRTVLQDGRAGIGSGIAQAWQWLEAGLADQVLVVAVDSYLNAATINHFLGERQLLVTDMPAGFIPGEAAAAVVLARPLPHSAQSSQVLISGIGQAVEEGKPDGEVPNRAVGLTQAIRDALMQASLSPQELDFRVTDHNGSPFLAAESSLAYARLMSGAGTTLEMLNPAEHVGEVGSAIGVIGLAYAGQLLARQQILGTVGVIHMSNDDGRRAAVVIERA